jgi:hypothetical protein
MLRKRIMRTSISDDSENYRLLKFLITASGKYTTKHA